MNNRQLHILISPGFMCGLCLLLLNDFVLKQHFHNGLTEKMLERMSFALEVRRCGFGFAAGVGSAAVAMPRRKMPFTLLGYALGAAFGPINPKG